MRNIVIAVAAFALIGCATKEASTVDTTQVTDTTVVTDSTSK
jgi:uncharacterized protein YcfL